ncbi:MAG TPA: ABC transporter ATP-binding protein [Porphyromonadaceae bacterium]|nr:ABC transporter ATP-binding protein [Porphyromonadaceae bacterium]
MIKLENVTKVFQTKEEAFTALKNINFVFNDGEYIAIVGKSGSGKSTFLNMIAGIDYPTKGSVEINNTITAHLNESELALWRGKNIGIIFQFFQLIPTLTVMENILLAMEFVDVVPKAERVQRAKKLLEQMDILEQANKMPASLSGGQQQRVAIARALANDPPIIIADEPTGNLDSKTSEAINGLLKSLSQSGKTVIVVTHETGIAAHYDRTIILSDGEIVDVQP